MRAFGPGSLANGALPAGCGASSPAGNTTFGARKRVLGGTKSRDMAASSKVPAPLSPPLLLSEGFRRRSVYQKAR